MPTNNRTRPALTASIRQRLFAMLGGCCDECGEVCGLEINHIYTPRGYVPRKLGSYQRNLRYLKDAKQGLVNLLCKECNSRYRPKPRPQPADAPSEVPF